MYCITKKKSKNSKNSFYLNVCCILVFHVFLFFYGPFCHGALKLDMPTLFTTFFLRTSL